MPEKYLSLTIAYIINQIESSDSRDIIIPSILLLHKLTPYVQGTELPEKTLELALQKLKEPGIIFACYKAGYQELIYENLDKTIPLEYKTMHIEYLNKLLVFYQKNESELKNEITPEALFILCWDKFLIL